MIVLLSSIWGYGKEDILDVFSTYFKTGTWAGNGFVEAVVIAVALAVFALLIFYPLIGNVSFKLSKLSTWIVVGALAGILSFSVTSINTGLTSGCGYGLQKTLTSQFKKKTSGVDSESAQYKDLEKCKKNHQKHFRKGVFNTTPVFRLSLASSLLTILLYGGLSCVRPVRRILKNQYAQNIPIK